MSLTQREKYNNLEIEVRENSFIYAAQVIF